MKAIFLSVALTLSASAALASSIEIKCGDTHKNYIGADLSSEFKADYLNAEASQKDKKNGYDSKYAGRNCFKVTYATDNQYEVLIKSSYKKIGKDIFGPFSINPASIVIENASEDQLERGIVLTGTKESLKSADGKVSATLQDSRSADFSKIQIIIRKFM